MLTGPNCPSCDHRVPHRNTHIRSHQCVRRRGDYCTRPASFPAGRSCHPGPRLTHRCGAFTHLEPLALPPAGSHRLNRPLDITVLEQLGTTHVCFFSYPVSRRSGSHNAPWHSLTRDMATFTTISYCLWNVVLLHIHIFSSWPLGVEYSHLCRQAFLKMYPSYTHTHTFVIFFPLCSQSVARHQSTTGNMLTLFEWSNPCICLQYDYISKLWTSSHCVRPVKQMVKAQQPFQNRCINIFNGLLTVKRGWVGGTSLEFCLCKHVEKTDIPAFVESYGRLSIQCFLFCNRNHLKCILLKIMIEFVPTKTL